MTILTALFSYIFATLVIITCVVLPVLFAVAFIITLIGSIINPKISLFKGGSKGGLVSDAEKAGGLGYPGGCDNSSDGGCCDCSAE